MNRVVFLAFVAFGFSGWSAAQAQPLTFGAINGSGDFSARADVAQCRPESGHVDQCALKRSSFGGLPVSRTAMALNPDGKVRSLGIVLGGGDFELAYQLLVGRYGQPTTTHDFPRWTGFDDGASLSIRRTGADAIVSFDFPANGAAPANGSDATLVVVLLAGLGLAAGGLAYREYAKRARPVPVPQGSMRATLERRLREGRDLTF